MNEVNGKSNEVSSKRRILVTGLTNDAGGTERVIYNLTSRMQDYFNFDYICRDYPERYNSLFGRENRCHIVPYRSENPIEHVKAVNRIFDTYSDEYIAVWCHMSTLANINFLKYAANAKVPIRIMHMHSKAELGPFYKRLLGGLHKKRALNLATHHWACSRESADYFFGPGSGSVIPNAIAIGEFAFSASKREKLRLRHQLEASTVIGTVGRLSPEKNQVFLLEILKQLLEEGYDAKLLIVGEGKLRSSLLAKAAALNLSESVILAGAQEDIQAYLSAFDVFALPSLYEALPVSLVEAQCNGLPCITSSGVTHEVDVSNGIVHLPLSERSSWMNAIKKMHRDNIALDFDGRLGFFSIDKQVWKITQSFSESWRM